MAKKKKRGNTPRAQKNAKPPKKEPFRMPKWGWITILCILAAVVLGLLGYGVYYNLSDLPVNSEGEILTKGENILFFNVGTTSKPRYMRYGKVEAAEGYRLDGENDVRASGDRAYTFLPEGGDAALTRYVLTVANGNYDEIIESTRDTVLSYLGDGTSTDEVHVDIAGHDLYYYTYLANETDEETGDVLATYRVINAYVKAKTPYSILASLTLLESRGAEPLPEEEINGLLTLVLEGLTVQ